jgi:hypothetical protein
METQLPARILTGSPASATVTPFLTRAGFVVRRAKAECNGYIHEVSSGAREKPPHAGSPSAPE